MMFQLSWSTGQLYDGPSARWKGGELERKSEKSSMSQRKHMWVLASIPKQQMRRKGGNLHLLE